MMNEDMSHEDATQDASMITSVLRKIADEMDGLEANRIHPRVEKMEIAAVAPKAEEPEEEETEDGLDPEILGKLLEKAGAADESGALPEDHENELPDEVMMAIKKKKGLLK